VYEAVADAHAVRDLAQQLVAAGIADAPLHIRQRGVSGMLPVISFHALADA
jgi:hypothetical protein